jgi:hypothetical protein
VAPTHHDDADVGLGSQRVAGLGLPTTTMMPMLDGQSARRRAGPPDHHDDADVGLGSQRVAGLGLLALQVPRAAPAPPGPVQPLVFMQIEDIPTCQSGCHKLVVF